MCVCLFIGAFVLARDFLQILNIISVLTYEIVGQINARFSRALDLHSFFLIAREIFVKPAFVTFDVCTTHVINMHVYCALITYRENNTLTFERGGGRH